MNPNQRWVRVLVSGHPGAAAAHEFPLHSVGALHHAVATGGQAHPEDLSAGLGPARATPLVDIHDRSDALVLEADLPGVAEEEIVVELKQNVLKLVAKVRRPDLENARPLALESTVMAYERSFILSDEFDREQIQAEFEHGVLRLTIPRTQRVVSRRIAVNARTKKPGDADS
jgi:HSP20 family molecular chaperone IbpA